MNTEFGVCYYPEHWPESLWKQDAEEMVSLGLSWVRIGEFAWSRIEPREGEYEWDWLDSAVTTLGEAGLKIILGTPTATPPRWVLSKFPDMIAVDASGQPRRFGSRRHYCFSHAAYRELAAQITEKIAKRYGKNPFVQAWQMDNEYGCHDTVLSYSPHARRAFQTWLSKKYASQRNHDKSSERPPENSGQNISSIERLNEAWGNVFWSMEYKGFTEIGLPNLTVTEPNPAHVMDFRRFSSDQVLEFDYLQREAIRCHSDYPISHNYMGKIVEFDHFALGKELDFATWDTYPLGFLEDRVTANDKHKATYLRTGDPDFQAFHHDLYRAVGKGHWWIMEQQPGAVNWATYNPAPATGAVKMWVTEAAAHGANVVSFFRWRQAPFAQEQMHAGLKTPDNQPSQTYEEIASAISEIRAVVTDETADAEVAILFDYPSAWAWQTQPQGKGFNYFDVVFDVYRALRRHGCSVDIISSQAEDFGSRKLVFIPAMFAMIEPLEKALDVFDGEIVFGPRSFSRTQDFSMAMKLPEITGLDVTLRSVETVPECCEIDFDGTGHVKIWREFIETEDEVLKEFADGHPFHIKAGKAHYLAGWADDTAMDEIIVGLLNHVGLEFEKMSGGLRRRQRGQTVFYTNYGPDNAYAGDQELNLAGTLIMDMPS